MWLRHHLGARSGVAERPDRRVRRFALEDRSRSFAQTLTRHCGGRQIPLAGRSSAAWASPIAARQRPWPSREWDAWRIYDAVQTETGEVPLKPSDVPVLVLAVLHSLKSTAGRSHSPPASSQCQSRAGDEAIRPIICSSQWRAAATFDNTGV